MILYEKTGCWHCYKVLDAMKRLHLDSEHKNIKDADVVKELIERGGKKQVPFLIDEAHNVKMYESDEIVKYLEKTYAQ